MPTRTLSLIALACLSLGLAGCSSSVPSVDGTLVDGGKAYSPKADEYVSINLTSEDGTRSYSGKVEAEGKFSIQSSDGKGVRTGKYKVSVSIYQSPTAGKGGPPAPKTLDTGEVIEVSSANRTLTVDLSKAKVDTSTGKEAKKK
jgi:hypothetical protein